MTARTFTITASPEVINELAATLTKDGCSVSQPIRSRSVADALDAPIGADELRAVMEIITIGSAATVTIIKALVAAVKNLENDETIVVGDARTGKQLAEATKTTDEGALHKQLDAVAAT